MATGQNLPKISVSIQEAADLTGLSDQSIRRLLKIGQLRFNNFFRKKLILYADLVRFMESGGDLKVNVFNCR